MITTADVLDRAATDIAIGRIKVADLLNACAESGRSAPADYSNASTSAKAGD